MAHIVGNTIADKQERIDRLRRSSLTINDPSVARGTLVKAAELERELEAEKADLLEKGAKWTKGADGRLTLSEPPSSLDLSDETRTVRRAMSLVERNRPTIQKMLDDAKLSAAPSPPIGMPARPHSEGSTSVETRPRPTPPHLMSPADRAAYFRKMADSVDDRSAAQGYRLKAAEADKET